jgi:hypothetical protein
LTCARRHSLYLTPDQAQTVQRNLPEFEAASECWVERAQPKPRKLNVRAYLDTIALTENLLNFSLRVTPYGTVRADEVARVLGLDRVLESGTRIERTNLELHDEISPAELARAPEFSREQLVLPLPQLSEERLDPETLAAPSSRYAFPEEAAVE